MGITRTWREEAPSSYMLKVVGYSELKDETTFPKPYESALFTASGYQWRLILYRVGKEKDGGKNHLSIYIRLETATSDISKNWEIQVDMKFFVFDQKQNKYLTVQDGVVKRYSEAKKELGIAQFIERSVLEDQKNGYVVNDTCIFGVEIFILKPAEKLETLTILHNPPNNKFTWKILHFSNLSDRILYWSDAFVIGQRYWRIRIDPKKSGNGLSAFLVPVTHMRNSVVSGSYAMFKLRVLNQLNSNHIERIATCFYAAGYDPGYGPRCLISNQDLYHQSKGYLVNDTITFEVEVFCVNQTQVNSN